MDIRAWRLLFQTGQVAPLLRYSLCRRWYSIVMYSLYVLEVMNIVNTCLGEVVRVYDITYILLAIWLRIFSWRLLTDLRRSLNWRREVRFGMESLHSFNLASKSQFSLSVSSDSAAILMAMISKSEEWGTGLGRRTFPCFVTNSLENCLHISRNLTNFYISCA